ncbi:aminodeoxychorismate synthase component I [uncultured Desulfosarcina sp.]|uniref:aminodeoxychorismate synthase component I n=1 Tax=uncultured Desulfosarcina sp. TaxID=218289 RepID=UPI0029C777A0|nr:aminodeoxychorismate synthase component I [uncultured Desulfosarcina sp.]
MKLPADHLPEISGVKTESLNLEEPFAAMAARFAREPGTVVLLSGGDLDCARYHILALRPWLSLSGSGRKTTLTIDGDLHETDQAPLDVLQQTLARYRLNPEAFPPPVAAGLFGYLAYDLKDGLEDLPRTTVDDLGLPHIYLTAPSLVVVHDKADATTRVHAPVFEGSGFEGAEAALAAFRQALKAPSPSPGGFTATGEKLHSNVSRSEYEAAVRRIREYIAAGDVYQVNLSQRFEMGFTGDGYSLFQTLYDMNPAPFFAYVNAGDHQIISTSPERFLLRKGGWVETRPIKGTRPRGRTPEEDRQMKSELAQSPKDDAELSMIVDLLRNDIGKVCAGGSVKVAQHKRLEAYRNVYHLVSVVEGELAEDKDSVALIRAAFPGGSITGCPKIRSMEIIDELEACRRHIYTGSIGYIGFHDTMDLSIAIRTATIVRDRLIFSVGGGIVYDSDPADEYEETLHKGRTLMSVFQGAKGSSRERNKGEPFVWLNGRILPQSRATVPVADLGLQYGYGIFETVRVEKGRACRLQAHVDRFNRSWEALFCFMPPDVTWTDVIAQVVEKNGLADAVAAVKILATRGEESSDSINNTLLVSARPYIHRLEVLGTKGLRLATFPHPRMTPLADHKSLNYLFYHQAGAWARQQGADEALILNPDGTISETNTANILVVSGRTANRPSSPYVLPGVMQAEICQRLAVQGFSILDEPIRPEVLHHADAVLVTNALMGVVPGLSLDNQPLKTDPTLIEALHQSLFPTGVRL